jgi:hypothetical protein
VALASITYEARAADAEVSCVPQESGDYLSQVASSCGGLGIASDADCDSVKTHRRCAEEITERASGATRKSCEGKSAVECPDLMRAALAQYTSVANYQSCVRSREVEACKYKNRKESEKADVADVGKTEHEHRHEIQGAVRDLLGDAYRGMSEANAAYEALLKRSPAASAEELAAAEARRSAAAANLTAAQRSAKLVKALSKDNKSTAQETKKLKEALAKISGNENAQRVSKAADEMNDSRKQMREEKRELAGKAVDRKDLRKELTQAEVKKEKAEGKKEISEARAKLKAAQAEHNPKVDAAAKNLNGAKALLEAARRDKVAPSILADLEAKKNAAQAELRVAAEARDKAVLSAQNTVKNEQKEQKNEIARVRSGERIDMSEAARAARADFKEEKTALREEYAEQTKEAREAYVRERTQKSMIEAQIQALRSASGSEEDIAELQRQLKAQNKEAREAQRELAEASREPKKKMQQKIKNAAQERDEKIRSASRK